MNEEHKKPSRLQAHRNALLLSLAFASFFVGVAYLPVADAYLHQGGPHDYNEDVDIIYTDWSHPGWIEITTTAYSNGQKLDAIEYSTDYGGTTSTYTIAKTDSGTTTLNDYERIAWAEFTCREWWWIFVIREETPILNTHVEYLGGGGFDFTDYYYD
ncbi:MAG: hypothetical protein ACFFE2_12525 [Candidatus Thorarchaeota archaeon]